MKRTLLVTAALALSGIGMAIAQSGPLPSTTVMRDQGAVLYRTMGGIVKGEAPFEKAKVDELFAQLAASVAKIPNVYPDSSKGKVGENSRFSPSPKIWESPDQFKAAAAAAAKAIADNRGKTGSLEEFKGAVTAVGNACNACHDVYRVRVN